MRIYIGVHGSKLASSPVIVDKTTVYVHSNVRENVVTDELTGRTYTEYVYDEIQYTRQEWEQIMSNTQAQLEDSICTVDSDIEEIKDALCELDEQLNGGSEDE
jgi:hypothetical protein